MNLNIHLIIHHDYLSWFQIHLNWLENHSHEERMGEEERTESNTKSCKKKTNGTKQSSTSSHTHTHTQNFPHSHGFEWVWTRHRYREFREMKQIIRNKKHEPSSELKKKKRKQIALPFCNVLCLFCSCHAHEYILLSAVCKCVRFSKIIASASNIFS